MNNQYEQQQQPELQPLSEHHPPIQQRSAVHFVYNVAPSTKELTHSAAIPNAVHYNPFHPDLDPEVVAHFEGIQCTNCQTYLNRYCEMLKGQMGWVCCMCNHLNRAERSVDRAVMEGETYDIFTKQKHVKETKTQKLYLFLVDLCISPKQMKAVQQSLLSFVKAKSHEHYEGVQLVNKIGIITYSKFVYCYELSSQINTVVSIAAEQDYDLDEFYHFLGLNSEDTNEISKKYFISIQSGLQKIEKRIRNIKAEGDVQHQDDPQHRCRSKRAYGQALNLAINLCENIQAQCRIVSLVGGPCTHGVGSTIGTSFKQHMRSISDYENGQNIHYFQSASNFYKYLKLRVEGKRVVLDFFIFSTEETGLTEMYDLVRATGGLLVLGEQFAGDLCIFPKSFAKAYMQSDSNEMANSLVFHALGTLKQMELWGHGREFVSSKGIGFGDTNIWAIGGINCYRAITFFYELSASKASGSGYFLQFKTAYKDYWGFKKTRITTVKGLFDTNKSVIADNFDQEAAIVAVARWYLYKSEFEPKTNLRLWLDKLLVRWATNFATYIRGDFQSFSLSEKMKYLPQFFYHFRRNPMIRRSGLSLDELTYQIHTLNSQTVEHCIAIIQPALLCYTIQKPYPSPVRLEEEQMKNEAILLLDTHFHVVIWYGDNIEYWEKQEYHKQKQYQHVKALMEAPTEDVEYLLNSRFPWPGFYKTSRGSSKERILKSKISPATGEAQHENALTDDKSLQAFMKALVEIIVS